ncbi:hypothetical protein AU489_13515 [Lonsdalea populi]|uniref:Uncharacterized protein n=2 Tax=Lonsdalea TaxID=1082702 RepID=A0ACD1JCY4_9GAMM|nr:hypothetical protein AU485_09285 [Lonsdalea quercina]RAT17942.1 hypothetical protein AU487_15020 [Lonsdalea populi]RAT22102.1 hypothetical protein AU489_13515 [Lonsdalea populi]RAT24041.1 hypothetical protein AU488_08895 [Lonsdalea populi]RAT33911.1 hypothetical protein AU492_09670 [Lonsdalea populi]
MPPLEGPLSVGYKTGPRIFADAGPTLKDEIENKLNSGKRMPLSLWTPASHKETDQEQNDTDHEDDFSCARRCTRQSAETQRGGDQRHNQKNNTPTKHTLSFNIW